MDTNQAKDQNVVSFMMQLIQEKHGDEVDINFLNQEADKLYNQFGDQLVTYFEPQLTPEQRESFDKMVSGGSDQDKMLDFLIDAIPTLEEQIMDVLVKFRADYLAQKSES